MDKDKSPTHGEGLPPPSGRYSSHLPTYNVKPEPSSSPPFPPLASGATVEPGHFGHGMSTESNHFSHDISRMLDCPPRKLGHRRAHSEIVTLPDDIGFDSDLGVVGVADGPSFSDETEEDLLSMYLDMDKFNSSSTTSAFQMGEPSASATPVAPATRAVTSSTENISMAIHERPRVRHQHSQSMDGSTTIKTEMLVSSSEDMFAANSRKAMSATKLSELALIDPKRAKRIWANRQSATRSKERKMQYIAELEHNVQTLQTDATSLSAKLTLMQSDTNGLTAENSELKLCLQTMEQQVHLQDALNNALKEEIQHLEVLIGQAMPNGGPMMNFACFGVCADAGPSAGHQFYPNNQAMHTFLTSQQFQQLQIHSQKQQHQFQQHQLHQLQQQHMQEQQQQQQQQPQPPLQQQQQQEIKDSKIEATMQSPSQKDNALEVNQAVAKDC